ALPLSYAPIQTAWSYRLRPRQASGLKAGEPPPPSSDESGRCQHLLYLVDEVAEVDRLGQHFGVLGGGGIRVQRHGRKAGDEHDLDVGVEFGGATSKLDAV